MVAAVIYVLSSIWMFWKGFGDQPRMLARVGLVMAAGLVAWWFSRRRSVAPPA